MWLRLTQALTLFLTLVKSVTTADVITANPSSNPIPNPSQICDDGGCDYD